MDHQVVERYAQKVARFCLFHLELKLFFFSQTQLARAIAGESRAPLLSIGPSDVLSKFVGESEATIRSVFNRGKPLVRR